MISALLLAAGESKRMGAPKQLLTLEGVSILKRSLQSLLRSGVDEVILVLGYRCGDIRQKLAVTDKRVRIAYNRDYGKGMGASIARGMKALSRESEAVLISLGDQPCINPSTIDAIINAFRGGEKGIVIPVCQDMRGHPVLFSRRYFPDLLQLSGDRGGSAIVAAHHDDVSLLDTDDEGVILDLDTPGDFRRLEERYAGGPL